MKYPMLIVSLICFLFTFNSCGGDEGEETNCATADWIGVYELASEAECEYAPMSTLVFNDEIVIEDSGNETTILWDGFEETLMECTVNDGILTLTLSGNTITSTIGECAATYNRQ